MWLDEQEEIRTAVDTWSQTLLPAHFEAIARCWNEALSKSPISERVKLVSFLSQLRSHFPAWRVLMWETIIEALLENDFMQKGDEDGPAAAHLSLYGLSSDEGQPTAQIDPELILLRVGLISLSLRMIADGISIDTFSLLRLKDQIARALGFQDVTLVPSSSGHTFHIRFGDTSGIPSWAFPSITDLMLVLDSAHPYDLAGSAMGGPYVDDDSPTTLLVGSAFVDLVLGLFTHTADLASLPPLTLKNLIKGLLIAIQKHDFDSRPLRHLQGDLRKAIRLNLFTLVIENSLSYDLRQLAFSATQAFIKRCPTMVGNFVFEAMLEVMKMMVTLDYEQKAEDLLVLQATVFLETILQMFSMSGIMAMLFKKRLEPNFFRVLRHVLDSSAKSTVLDGSKENLREILLRDTLSRVIDSDVESYQTAVENLQDYVEIVYHTAYNSDLMQCEYFIFA
ncbi:hypothetical protein EW026_g2637 [Hermanssonia centrifuga]|uniref:Uncharacterized protein n=1 Tax=Hermanssonia centrifuga TaxID=98765 RepID=A0A4S4KML7_9APHY|nr:hypothetical protein EW026_g2637 [Hermanssonia centrifuga]